MWHSIRNANPKVSNSNATSKRKSGEEITLVGRHVSACLVVVTYCKIKLLGRGVLQPEYKMPE